LATLFAPPAPLVRAWPVYARVRTLVARSCAASRAQHDIMAQIHSDPCY